MAAQSLPHAHSSGASLRQASDHSYPVVVSGHDQIDAGGGRTRARWRHALLYRIACGRGGAL